MKEQVAFFLSFFCCSLTETPEARNVAQEIARSPLKRFDSVFEHTSLLCHFRCPIKSVLSSSVGRFPAPGNRHLHEARLARWGAHQLLPGPIQGVWLTGLEGCQVTQCPESVLLLRT